MTARHEELKVFQLADRLALDIYKLSGGLPAAERDGLQAQLRRAAVAVPIGIIEGCARSAAAERAQLVGAALGAASEMRYLLSLLHRLELIEERDFAALNDDYDLLVRGLQKFVSAMRDDQGQPRPRRDGGDEARRENPQREERRDGDDRPRAPQRAGYSDERRGPPPNRRRDSDWRR